MKKKIVIGLGVVMGGIASMVAMIPHSTPTKAAVLVHDQENIAQAIKEVAQTAEILINAKNQLEIMKINIKSLDWQTLTGFKTKQQEAMGGCFGTGLITLTPDELLKIGKTPGILNRHRTVTDVLESSIGTVEGVFNGTTNYEDLYLQAQRTQKALDATYKDAAEAAQNVQHSDEKLTDMVNDAIDAANNAKGKKEVQQAAIAIAAANAIETRNTNHLLANILAVAVDDAYSRNIEKAKAQKREHELNEKLLKATGAK